jgi:hypothetical protein
MVKFNNYSYWYNALSTGSAMVMSTASVSEFKDPIIYSFHPRRQSFTKLIKKRKEVFMMQANTSAMHTTHTKLGCQTMIKRLGHPT